MFEGTTLGYFGGLGAGKGWRRFNFFLAPAELAEVLAGIPLRLIINNRRVARSYVETLPGEYLKTYAEYCALVSEGPRSDRVDLSMGVTDPDLLIHSEPCPERQYKLLLPTSPVINLAPFTLGTWDGEEICVNVGTRYEGVFGLQMSFPKVYSLDTDGHWEQHSTQDSANEALYLNLVCAIKSKARQCRLEHRGQERRIPLWMSEAGLEIARQHPFLQQFEVVLRLPTDGKSLSAPRDHGDGSGRGRQVD